jgi:hypothetical protein
LRSGKTDAIFFVVARCTFACFCKRFAAGDDRFRDVAFECDDTPGAMQFPTEKEIEQKWF